MSDEQLSDKIETTVAGIKDYAFRFARTLLAVGVRPDQLVNALVNTSPARAYLSPNAFLLSCAIALGLLAKTFKGGLDIEVDVIQQFKDLTLWSFVLEIVAVFLIALVGAAAVNVLMHGHSANSKRQLKDLNYYVIGFFGIGSFLLLLLLFIAMPNNRDFSNWWMRWLSPIASGVVVGWVLFSLTVMQWMSFRVLRISDGKKPLLLPLIKTAVANVLVIGLCVVNFVTPVFRTEPEAPIRGSLLDLELQPDRQSIRIAYTVRNDADGRLVIHQSERPGIEAEIPGGDRVPAIGSFQDGCDLQPPKEMFVILDPGKAFVLTSCVTSAPLLKLLKDAGFGEATRDGDRFRLSQAGDTSFGLWIRMEVSKEGGKPTRQEVRLYSKKGRSQSLTGGDSKGF